MRFPKAVCHLVFLIFITTHKFITTHDMSGGDMSYGGLAYWLGVSHTWLQIPALSLTNYLVLCKSFELSTLTHLYNGDNSAHFIGLLWRKIRSWRQESSPLSTQKMFVKRVSEQVQAFSTILMKTNNWQMKRADLFMGNGKHTVQGIINTHMCVHMHAHFFTASLLVTV